MYIKIIDKEIVEK